MMLHKKYCRTSALNEQSNDTIYQEEKGVPVNLG